MSVSSCPGEIAPKIAPENWRKYLRVNLVDACPLTRGDYNKLRGWEIPQDENPNDEGYLIVYRKGKSNEYTSWCPKTEFDNVSKPTDGMTFGHAIEAMKHGFKVTRKGWNGKGMYIWMMSYAFVKAEWCKEPHLKELAEANGGEIECLGSIRMKTADNKVLTGWLASQTDMFAEDWQIVK